MSDQQPLPAWISGPRTALVPWVCTGPPLTVLSHVCSSLALEHSPSSSPGQVPLVLQASALTLLPGRHSSDPSSIVPAVCAPSPLLHLCSPALAWSGLLTWPPHQLSQSHATLCPAPSTRAWARRLLEKCGSWGRTDPREAGLRPSGGPGFSPGAGKFGPGVWDSFLLSRPVVGPRSNWSRDKCSGSCQ